MSSLSELRRRTSALGMIFAAFSEETSPDEIADTLREALRMVGDATEQCEPKRPGGTYSVPPTAEFTVSPIGPHDQLPPDCAPADKRPNPPKPPRVEAKGAPSTPALPSPGSIAGKLLMLCGSHPGTSEQLCQLASKHGIKNAKSVKDILYYLSSKKRGGLVRGEDGIYRVPPS